MVKPNLIRKEAAFLAVLLAACLIGWVVMAVNDRREYDTDPGKADRARRAKESSEMFRQKARDEKAANAGK